MSPSVILPAAAMLPAFPPEWAEIFGEDDAGVFAEFTLKDVPFVWRWIPPGRFRMGCDLEDAHGNPGEKPQHPVTIVRGFWLGETPITQAQWLTLRSENPSRFQGEDRPVEQVTWPECVAFASDLTIAVPGLEAALPTEAQWEYACRAGKQSAFNDGTFCTLPEGNDPALDRLGWFDKNSGGGTHLVKQKLPNSWGLFDLHGNVWEWCRDRWEGDAYLRRASGATDPHLESSDPSAKRVVRGGSWDSLAGSCRAAFRSVRLPEYRWYDRGFRLAAGLELRVPDSKSLSQG